MDDPAYFDVEEQVLTADQLSFLSALRTRLGDHLHPYCIESTETTLLLGLDLDAPHQALVTVGLELREGTLRGDRIDIHDRSFPPDPTPEGFVVEGTPNELAARGGEFFERSARRPIVRHQWLHDGRVYADCYLFEDTGERLAQMYRSDWAPPGQEDRLIAEGFVRGAGWIQTKGLGEPDRATVVSGERDHRGNT